VRNIKTTEEKIFIETFRQIGVPIEILAFPDEVDRTNKAVDIHAKYKNQNVWVEITQVESFSNQIAQSHKLKFLWDGLEKELKEILPSSPKLNLLINIDADTYVKKSKQEQIKAQLKNWIIESAKLIVKKCQNGDKIPISIVGSKKDIPFKYSLHLYRNVPPSSNNFSVMFSTPSDMKEERVKRLTQALNNKLPKLSKSKTNLNDITVLILYIDDIQLSENYTVLDSLKQCISTVDKKLVPNEIFIVDASMSPYIVTPFFNFFKSVYK